MADEQPGTGWRAGQVYILSAICLGLGVLLGYFWRGSASPRAPQITESTAAMPNLGAGQMPTLEQMKHMADKQAEPLLLKLRTTPTDAGLLAQIGQVYRSAHQFKEATEYYGKSLELDPKNVAIRTEMASCLYYTGDTDGALQQLQQALKNDPKNSNALFNLGLIEWKEKRDAGGALAAWNQLLTSNPDLPAEKKSQVNKLIAEVKQAKAIKH